jgi:hypothetical protein
MSNDQKIISIKQKIKKRVKGEGLTAIGSLLDKYQLEDKGGHITQEFQDFGYRLAMELNDEAHKSLYMRLAKVTDRIILEKALSFVKDANARSPARLFMWKVKQLKEEGKK